MRRPVDVLAIDIATHNFSSLARMVEVPGQPAARATKVERRVKSHPALLVEVVKNLGKVSGTTCPVVVVIGAVVTFSVLRRRNIAAICLDQSSLVQAFLIPNN